MAYNYSSRLPGRTKFNTGYNNRYSSPDRSEWTLNDWQQYATRDQSKWYQYLGAPGSGTYKTKTAWRGGYLTPDELSQVSWLEQQNLKNEYQTAFDRAKESNEKRYRQTLAGYDDMYGTQQEMMEGMGDSEKRELERIAGKGYAQNADLAVKSGMLGTTVLPALNSRTSEQHARMLDSLNERLDRMRLGAYTDYKTGKLGVMERREDVYPDFSQLIALSRGLGNT